MDSLRRGFASELSGVHQSGSSPQHEVRRICLPRTSVNKGKKKGPELLHSGPSYTLHSCRRNDFLSLEERRRQTFEEALRDGEEEVLILSGRADNSHLLAVGGYRILRVCSHSVEAPTANDYVLERRHVGDYQHIVARPTNEGVGRRFAQGAIDQEIIASSTQGVVGALASDNRIVTLPSY